MNCPKCKKEMESGEFYLDTTIGGFFIFGLSFKNLYFKSNKNKIKLIQNNETATGYFCKHCELSIYLNKINDDPGKKCSSCGTISYHGGNKCIYCGKPI